MKQINIEIEKLQMWMKKYFYLRQWTKITIQKTFKKFEFEVVHFDSGDGQLTTPIIIIIKQCG